MSSSRLFVWLDFQNWLITSKFDIMEIIKQIKEYRKLLKDPENTIDVFDGRGTGVDVYICDYNPEHQFRTYYKDYGVTPYTIRCRECKHGTMRHLRTIKCPSEIYRDALADGYWYRPGMWYFLMHRHEREHLLLGGLVLKRCK